MKSNEKPKRSKKSIILQIVGYIVIIALIVFLVLTTDINEIIESVKLLDIRILFVLFGLQIVTQFLLLLQWLFISKKVVGSKVTLRQILYIFTRGTVVEAITPGAKIGGEVTRVYYLKKDCGASTENACNVVIIQKSISMSVLLTICVASFFYLNTLLANFISIPIRIIIAVVSIVLIFLMLWLLFFSSQLSNFLSKRKSKALLKIGNFATKYSLATNTLGRGSWLLQFTLSLLIWGLFPFKMVVLAKAMGIELSTIVLLAITMTSYMMGMLPLTPGGVGTFEGTMISLFILLGVTSAVSVTATVIFRFVTFWFVVLTSALITVIFRVCTKSKTASEQSDLVDISCKVIDNKTNINNDFNEGEDNVE